MANTEMVQAEFARGQLDKDDVSIEQICVLSEIEREHKILLNIHVRQFMHTHTHTYSVALCPTSHHQHQQLMN